MPLARRVGSSLIRRYRYMCRSCSSRSKSSIGSEAAMADEYSLTSNVEKPKSLFDACYTYPGEFLLESGQSFLNPVVGYSTYGKLNSKRDNIIVVCHALTGHSRLDQWWSRLLGGSDMHPFNTDKYFIICCNVLGSCYGSTGPLSLDSRTGRPFLKAFPKVSIRDSVRIQMQLLLDSFGATGVRCVVGGSMGGMQALEWLLLSNSSRSNCSSKVKVDSAVIIASGACHDAWQIGFSECQRQAIYSDPKWNDGDFNLNDPPKSGLQLARQIAMLSYRSPISYDKKFSRLRASTVRGSDKSSPEEEFLVKEYLAYQGRKFADRFDASSYKVLTEKMDSHDIGAHYNKFSAGNSNISTNNNISSSKQQETLEESHIKVLNSIDKPTLIVGIDSDVLYPLYQQQFLHRHIKHSHMSVIQSTHGHDAFLLEQDQLALIITKFMNDHHL